MTVIDHRCYPHLIDQVWNHLPPSSLNAMRQVCRSWFVRAALRRSTHFVAVKAPDARVGVLARGAAFPGLPTPFALVTQEVKGAQEAMVANEFSVPYAYQLNGTPFAERLSDDGPGAGIRDTVLDVVGFDPGLVRERDFPFLLFSKATVRWKFSPRSCIKDHPDSGAYFPDIGETRVIFMDIRDEKVFAWVDTCAYNEVAVDLVFNFKCYVDPTALMTTPTVEGEWCWAQDQAVATFIFRNCLPDDQPRSAMNPTFVVGLLSAKPASCVCYSLVGLDEFFTVPGEFAMFTSLVREAYKVKNENRRGHMAWFDGSVRYFSHAEYRAQVGADAYALRTFE